MKTIGKYILTGLITTLPVILTLYILYWLAVTAETLLADLVPRGIYLPGMGVATALLVMLVIGMMIVVMLLTGQGVVEALLAPERHYHHPRHIDRGQDSRDSCNAPQYLFTGEC